MAASDHRRVTPAGPGTLAWSRAEALGAVQEARRLGSPVVGTEHVLMAGFADPTVRRVFSGVGVDMRAVQALVERASAGRAARRPGDHPGLTPRAAAVVLEVSTDPAHPESVAVDIDRTRALRATVTTFLTAEPGSAARGVLDELAVSGDRARIVAALAADDRPDDLPRPRPPS